MPCCPNIARNGTAAEWAAADPVLRAGEFGYVTDTGELYIGDGVTPWSGLTPISGGSAGGAGPLTWRPIYGALTRVGWNDPEALVGNESTYLQTDNGNVNNELTIDVGLQGTFDVMLSHHSGANRGIYHLAIDGVEFGTVDGYSVGLVTGVRTVVSGAVLTGDNEFRVRMATRNGLSSAFFGLLESVTFVRTGP